MTVSKFINAIMYDGKRSSAEKILYDALDKMKNKNFTQNNENRSKQETLSYFGIR